jgi:hypothetical protein
MHLWSVPDSVLSILQLRPEVILMNHGVLTTDTQMHLGGPSHSIDTQCSTKSPGWGDAGAGRHTRGDV